MAEDAYEQLGPVENVPDAPEPTPTAPPMPTIPPPSLKPAKSAKSTKKTRATISGKTKSGKVAYKSEKNSNELNHNAPLRDDGVELNSHSGSKNMDVKSKKDKTDEKNKDKLDRQKKKNPKKKQPKAKEVKKSCWSTPVFVISLLLALVGTGGAVFVAAHRWLGLSFLEAITYN